MRKIGMILLALVLANITTAQNEGRAKQILDEVSAKTKTFKTLSAEFVFSMVNEDMDINEEDNGTIKVKGQKYKVILEAGYEIYSDGTTIWTYMKDGNQVTISSVDAEGSELMDLSSIFNIYERGFRSEFIAETQGNGKTIYKIELFPDTDEYDVTKIEVSIDKASMLLSSATLFALDENLYKIVVVKMETDVDFPDSDFIFDESNYDDVEVIDFR